eukprot:CAMPEP_0174922286 /NCGR_PEP_ID=MMETSP1355-20121228/5765_1 /TAXON_ID=464990 /ORGANISM="Hemiselmis tepida, Strain CCMP443" /LENGTH=1210 /DNA_ID=CAMNT_0016167861 /DNA_START=6 /DNA_END=3635 /DNA_ORIENTATION=+
MGDKEAGEMAEKDVSPNASESGLSSGNIELLSHMHSRDPALLKEDERLEIEWMERASDKGQPWALTKAALDAAGEAQKVNFWQNGGRVQNWGVLIVVDEARDCLITGCSVNVEEYFSLRTNKVLGSCLFDIFDQDTAVKIKSSMESKQATLLPVRASILGADFSTGAPVAAEANMVLQRRSGRLLCEIVPDRVTSESEGKQRSTAKSRASMQQLQMCNCYEGLLQIVVHELWSLTGFDRIMVYKLHELDQHGEVVAERMTTSVPAAYLGLHFPATDIPQNVRRNYYQMGYRHIPDVGRIGAEIAMLAGEPLPDIGTSNLRDIHPCHREYLRAMDVDAQVVCNVSVGGRLWGLCIMHNYSGKCHLSHPTLLSCEVLVKAFSIRLASILQDESHARQSRILGMQSQICDQIVQCRDVAAGLVKGPDDMRRVIDQAIGGCVISSGKVVARVGVLPGEETLTKLVEWACGNDYAAFKSRGEPPAGIRTPCTVRTIGVDSISECLGIDDAEEPCAGALLTRFKGGLLAWFRPAFEDSVTWAGDPALATEDMPRDSFARVMVQYHGRCIPWRSTDLHDAQGLAHLLDELAYTMDSEMSCKMLMRLTHERIENRTQCSALAAELVDLIEGANAPIFGMDTTGIATHWNRMTASLTGIKKEEALGQPLSKILGLSRYAARELEALSQKAQMWHNVRPVQLTITSRGGLYEYADLVAPGDVVDLYVGPTVSRDSSGKARDVMFVGQNVTEVKDTLAKCMDMEAGYQRVISDSASPIFGVDMDGLVTDWNAAAVAMTGVSQEEALGISFLGPNGIFGGLVTVTDETVLARLEILVHSALCGPLPDAAHQQERQQAAGAVEASNGPGGEEGGASGLEMADDLQFDFSCLNREGKRVEILIMASCGGMTISSQPGRGRDERIPNAILIAMDVSEKKALEVANTAYIAAKAASQAKTEQIGFLCHELRNPLNGVIGNVSLLNECSLSGDSKELAETALQCCTQLMRIMNDVLDMSKVEMGKLDIQKIPFDISTVVNTVCSQIRVTANDKGVDVDVEYRGFPGHTWIFGDPVRIQQVLSNFAWNSIKFTDVGRICFLLEMSDAEACAGSPGDSFMLRISVSDTGPGIPDETLKKLFQPFVQAEVSTFRQYGGTGLGLSICKQLAELMGGQVGATSTMGEGSVFFIELSEERVEPPEDGEEPGHSSQPDPFYYMRGGLDVGGTSY